MISGLLLHQVMLFIHSLDYPLFRKPKDAPCTMYILRKAYYVNFDLHWSAFLEVLCTESETKEQIYNLYCKFPGRRNMGAVISQLFLGPFSIHHRLLDTHEMELPPSSAHRRRFRTRRSGR